MRSRCPDIRENLGQLFAAFDELHLDEDLLFGGDGHVCARWTLRGVHTGEYGGIAPTHREIAVDTCEVYTFTGDKVTECYVYGETMSLFNQLSGELRMSELTASTLLHPNVLDEPYDFYRTLRNDAPVWAVPGTDVVTVATFDLISEAVGRPEDFSSNILSLLYRDDDGLPARLDFGGTAPPTLATADPPLHTTHRKAVFPELVARRMLTLEGDIRALCATAIDRALRDDPFEFMSTVGNVVPITVVAKLIGFRDINPAQLLEAAFDSTAMIGGTMTLDRLTELVTRIGAIQEWIRLQVAEHHGIRRATASCSPSGGRWMRARCRRARCRSSCTPCSARVAKRPAAWSATPFACSPTTKNCSSFCVKSPN